MHELLKLSSQGDEPLNSGNLLPWLRLGQSEEDESLLTGLAVAAREMAEGYCNRCFLQQVTYQETFLRERLGDPTLQGVSYHPWQEWRDWRRAAVPITLARGPLLQLVSIAVDGTVLLPAAYSVTGGDTVLPQVRLLQSTGWRRLIVTYAVGLGSTADAANLPPALALTAMQNIAGHLYANRESQEMPALAMRLLDLVGKLEA